ncbi:MAG: glycosyltransferase family 4 protein [Spirulinaceae cyanobacterium SM2_1_0]|nr:glycosyltransferase family 4 protein [Spirulinaceae cyanobacterium SM2_1_0]
MWLLLVIASFLLSLLLVGLVKTWLSAQLLDIPNERSSHQQPTPRGGGLGFLVAFGLTAGAALIISQVAPTLLPPAQLQPHPWRLVLPLLPLAIAGYLDDRDGLPARRRYGVQLGAAALAIASFGPLPGTETLLPVARVTMIGLTAIAITAAINFYNFMDGLDGLVASSTAIQLACFALLLNQPLWWLLAAALAGFLYWNWSPAKIFMGDAGSTILGASVAIAILNADTLVTAGSAALTTLPLIGDAVFTLTRRLLARENIFQAHRTHLYQRLQQSGWSHAKVATLYMMLTALSCQLAILVARRYAVAAL